MSFPQKRWVLRQKKVLRSMVSSGVMRSPGKMPPGSRLGAETPGDRAGSGKASLIPVAPPGEKTSKPPFLLDE